MWVFLSINPRRTWASRWTSLSLNLSRLIVPLVVASVATIVWHYCYQHQWFLPANSELMLGTAILVFAAIYAIPAGMILARIWERSRDISAFVLAHDKENFLRVRDEKIPILMHLALAAPALSILVLLGAAPYPSALTGELVVFSSWFTVLLYFVVVLELQEPTRSVWFRDRIPDEWRRIDLDIYFKIDERPASGANMPPASDLYIEDRIMSFADTRRRKVARIFGLVMQDCEDKGLAVTAATLDRRLRALIDAGRLEAFGDVTKWGYSEVRLVGPPTAPDEP